MLDPGPNSSSGRQMDNLTISYGTLWDPMDAPVLALTQQFHWAEAEAACDDAHSAISVAHYASDTTQLTLSQPDLVQDPS